MALLRLDAADREHETARRIAPVGAQRHHARHIEAGDDLAGDADLDVVAQVGADKARVDEGRPVAQRHAEMVHEFQRCGAGAAFLAVDHDEIGHDAGLEHRLDDGQELPRMAHAQLEARRLAARQARAAAR